MNYISDGDSEREKGGRCILIIFVTNGNENVQEEEETESEDGVWTLKRVLEKSVQENYPGLVLLCVTHKQL